MLGAVGEGLLDQPVGGQVDRLGQLPDLTGHVARHPQPGGREGGDQLVEPAEPAGRLYWLMVAGLPQQAYRQPEFLQAGLTGPLDVRERLPGLGRVVSRR